MKTFSVLSTSKLELFIYEIVTNICIKMGNGLEKIIFEKKRLFTMDEYTEKTGKTITLTLTDNVAITTKFCSNKKHKNEDIMKCILGTMAIPGVFSAWKIDDEIYYDGGFYNNYPIDYFDEKDEDGKLLKYCNNVLGFFLNNYVNLQPNDVLKYNFYFSWKCIELYKKCYEILSNCEEEIEIHNENKELKIWNVFNLPQFLNINSTMWNKSVWNLDFMKLLYKIADTFRKKSYGLVIWDEEFTMMCEHFKKITDIIGDNKELLEDNSFENFMSHIKLKNFLNNEFIWEKKNIITECENAKKVKIFYKKIINVFKDSIHIKYIKSCYEKFIKFYCNFILNCYVNFNESFERNDYIKTKLFKIYLNENQKIKFRIKYAMEKMNEFIETCNNVCK